jgi:Fe-S-cluster containining protein
MLSKRDVKRIAKHLDMTTLEFEEKYTIVDEDGDTVINASPCPFLLEDNKCRIYEDRPAACRLYPHSGEELFYKNLSHHKRNARYCPGLLEILKRIAQQH